MPTETVDDLLEHLKRLKIEENQVLTKLYQARIKEKGEQGGPQDCAPPYKQGDRVRIKNKIASVFPRRANTGDRDSTVLYTETRNGKLKIHIRTDNGFNTWRLEKNLLRIGSRK